MAARSCSTPKAVYLISRGVGIELIRRNAFYVISIIVGLYLIGVILLRLVGVDRPQTGTFILNLGLSLTYYCAHLMTLILAVRQLPEELENRTLYPILARPIQRSIVVAGKWVACTVYGILSLVGLGLLVWIAAPKMESYQISVLFQCLVLQAVSLGLLAALGVTVSLLMPKGVGLTLLALWFFAGSKVIGFIQARFAGSDFSDFVRWITAYLPDFSKLNLITRYTDGIGPLGMMEFAGLILYGALFIIVALLLASGLFQRRAL